MKLEESRDSRFSGLLFIHILQKSLYAPWAVKRKRPSVKCKTDMGSSSDGDRDENSCLFYFDQPLEG